MCTVKELIERLQQHPNHNAIVKVLEEYDGSYYTGTRFEELDLRPYSDNSEFYDDVIYLGDG